MEILAKAMRICFKSWKLMVSIVLIFFPFVYLIYFLFVHFVNPLINDYFNLPSSKHNPDLISPNSLMMIIKLILIIIYNSLVCFLLSMASIHLSSMCYSDKEYATMKTLLLKLRSTCWKGPIITYLRNIIINLGYNFIYLTYISKFWISSPIWVSMVSLLSDLSYVGSEVLFLGFVISVLEDEYSYGLKPLIRRTTDVLKEKGEQLLAIILIRLMIRWLPDLPYKELIHDNVKGSQFLASSVVIFGSLGYDMLTMVAYVVSYYRTMEKYEDQVREEILTSTSSSSFTTSLISTICIVLYFFKYAAEVVLNYYFI